MHHRLRTRWWRWSLLLRCHYYSGCFNQTMHDCFYRTYLEILSYRRCHQYDITSFGVLIECSYIHMSHLRVLAEHKQNPLLRAMGYIRLKPARTRTWWQCMKLTGNHCVESSTLPALLTAPFCCHNHGAEDPASEGVLAWMAMQIKQPLPWRRFKIRSSRRSNKRIRFCNTIYDDPRVRPIPCPGVHKQCQTSNVYTPALRSVHPQGTCASSTWCRLFNLASAGLGTLNVSIRGPLTGTRLFASLAWFRTSFAQLEKVRQFLIPATTTVEHGDPCEQDDIEWQPRMLAGKDIAESRASLGLDNVWVIPYQWKRRETLFGLLEDYGSHFRTATYNRGA